MLLDIDEKEHKVLMQMVGLTVQEFNSHIEQHRKICPDGENCEGEILGRAAIRIYSKLLKCLEDSVEGNNNNR